LPANAAIAYVQGGSSAGLGASRAVTYPSPQSAGSTNIAIVVWAAGAIISDLSDSSGSAYTLAGTTTASGGVQAVYYAKNVSAASTNVVTTTFSYSTYSSVVILQYTGIDLTAPFDGFAAASGFGTSANSASVSATTTNSLILGVISTSSGAATAGSGFTARVDTTSAGGTLTEDRFATATGSYTASAPLQTTGANWTAQVVIFRGASSTPGSQTAGAVTYQYDSFGRLKQVTVTPN
jgi:hypothetical protein